MEQKTESRRNFLKQAATATVVAGVATSGVLATTKKVEAHSSIPNKWDMEADVVVVGSGFAGLSAALTAKEVGASVIVLEKMPLAGGNSTINGGVFAAVGLPGQKEKDSPELMLEDMKKSGRGIAFTDQTRIVCEKSNEAWHWTRDYVGVKWRENLFHGGGHSVARNVQTKKGSGSGIIIPMLKKAKEIGVTLKKKTFVKQIIKNDDGRVIGLEVRTGYKHGVEDSGKAKFVKANKAVVMATGGFAADVKYLTSQDPRLDEKVDTTNHKGATADALKEMLRVGANPVQLSRLQLGPWASPDEKGFGVAPLFNIYSVFQHGITVANDTGERFMNELADRATRCDAMIRTGGPVIGVCDTPAAEKTPAIIREKTIGRGIAIAFDSLDALAAHYKVPANKLKEQVERYNKAVTTGIDTDFGKPLAMGQKSITQAPFYGIRLWPKVHHCMGGVQINTESQVLDINTQEPIEGLYACGEATGGQHGASRLIGCAIANCVVFGRIAGENAAKG